METINEKEILLKIGNTLKRGELTPEEFTQIRKAIAYWNRTYKEHLISLQN